MKSFVGSTNKNKLPFFLSSHATQKTATTTTTFKRGQRSSKVTRLTMKISILFIYCVATIVVPYCNAGFGDIIGKASDVGKLGVNVGKGVINKVPELIPTPENL
jgi:hypothetical protein